VTGEEKYEKGRKKIRQVLFKNNVRVTNLNVLLGSPRNELMNEQKKNRQNGYNDICLSLFNGFGFYSEQEP
jgi:hypothetical protein